MKRREFLLVSAGAGTAAAASGQAAAQEYSAEEMSRELQSSDGMLLQQEENDAEDNNNDVVEDTEPEEVLLELGDYYYQVADTGQNLADTPLEIEPGTLVRFVWITDNHDIVIDEQPEESDWEGITPTRDTGFEHEHTFDAEGTYEFHCTPHIALGMIGTIIVEEGITDVPDQPLPPWEQPIDPATIGVPLQKHFIGIATFFAIAVTLVFAFYVLKYGETPHSGYPNKRN